NGTGDVGLAGGGTSFSIKALGAADFRKPEGKGFPLRALLNFGYKMDNSGKIVADVEAARAKEFTDGRTTSPITRIERYGLGINIGVEFPPPKVQPYIEWSVDVPWNRQGYFCHTLHVTHGDACLGAANLNSPHAGGAGMEVVPSRLSIGVRTNPLEKAFRGLS